MLRILTLLATVATAATLSGGANAHPPDISVLYGTQSHAPHGYGQPTYGQPTYSQPRYSQPRYGRSDYARPGYDAVPLYSKAYGKPSYRRPVRRAPVYDAPVYRQPTYSPPAYPAPRVESYAGYATPGYGYRHRRGQSRPVRVRNWSPDRGIGAFQRAPMTESFSYGYRGGPTYGNDTDAVINGVRIYRPRD